MKLHLGCGKRDFGPAWTHVDGSRYSHVAHHDLLSLPWGDGAAELIYASHVIEYFDRDEAILLLKEWSRVLRQGGRMLLAVPDFEAMAGLYVAGKFPLKNLLGPLYGKIQLKDEWVYHKTVYDFNDLKFILNSLGFKNIHRYDWRETEFARFDDHSQAYLPHMEKETGTLISLNVQCEK